MNDTGVLSNWRKWKLEADATYQGNARYNNNEERRGFSTPTESRSDPSPSYGNPQRVATYERNNTDAGLGYTNYSQNRKPACFFRGGSESSRCSSFTNGFSSQPEDFNDDDATDILVWTTAPNNKDSSNSNTLMRQSHRSLSDTKSLFSSAYRSKPSIIKKSTSKSSLTKSLKLSKSQFEEDDENDEYENQLIAVTKQLEMIKSTQDSILSELSDDISTLQFDNVQLKNANEHLTMQNSHLLQVINDLSNEVEQMRQVFRNRGWSMNIIENPRNNGNEMKDSSTLQILAPASPKKKQRQKRNQERFENIPLDDGSPATTLLTGEKNGDTSSSPGDDQVSTLSNRSKHRDLPQGNRKQKSKSKKKVEESMPKNNNAGCFRSLFKRNNKHPSGEDEE